MEEEGLLIDFIKSNAVIAPPSCGPCMGGHMGVLGEGEVGLYTTNRNFMVEMVLRLQRCIYLIL